MIYSVPACRRPKPVLPRLAGLFSTRRHSASLLNQTLFMLRTGFTTRTAEVGFLTYS